MTYVIFQLSLTSDQLESINKNSTSTLAKAYFGLMFPNDSNAQERVNAALSAGLYEKTMLIGATDGLSVTLEQLFDAGNGYPSEGVNVVDLAGHSSVSVGDIAVSLLDDGAYLCMPMGWHVLDIELRLSLT